MLGASSIRRGPAVAAASCWPSTTPWSRSRGRATPSTSPSPSATGRGPPTPPTALIVATPTGSTAYAFSARGPIVSPRLRALVVTPVSPHMAFDRSLVVAADEPVRVEVADDRPAALTVDGRDRGLLRRGDAIVCRPSAQPARFVTFGPRDFYGILKAKFGGGRPLMLAELHVRDLGVIADLTLVLAAGDDRPHRRDRRRQDAGGGGHRAAGGRPGRPRPGPPRRRRGPGRGPLRGRRRRGRAGPGRPPHRPVAGLRRRAAGHRGRAGRGRPAHGRPPRPARPPVAPRGTGAAGRPRPLRRGRPRPPGRGQGSRWPRSTRPWPPSGGDARARAREIDLLAFQVGELDGAGLADPDEERRPGGGGGLPGRGRRPPPGGRRRPRRPPRRRGRGRRRGAGHRGPRRPPAVRRRSRPACGRWRPSWTRPRPTPARRPTPSPRTPSASTRSGPGGDCSGSCAASTVSGCPTSWRTGPTLAAGWPSSTRTTSG